MITFKFVPGKPIGNYLGNWDRFENCRALFRDKEVVISKVYAPYVDVIDSSTGEYMQNVANSSIVPLEYNE